MLISIIKQHLYFSQYLIFLKFISLIFELDDNDISFPDPSLAENDGLLAVGGDLRQERLLAAYELGIFPWYSHDEPILWYSPHERCVIFPDKVIISTSMKKIIERNIFRISFNEAFDKVIVNCKNIERKDQPGTWITNEMLNAYIDLNKAGIAESAEAWDNDGLAGGIYGVVKNNVFCGESMFSKKPNASKAVLINLCKSRRFSLIDCQMPNPHLISLGAEMISRKQYMEILHSR